MRRFSMLGATLWRVQAAAPMALVCVAACSSPKFETLPETGGSAGIGGSSGGASGGTSSGGASSGGAGGAATGGVAGIDAGGASGIDAGGDASDAGKSCWGPPQASLDVSTTTEWFGPVFTFPKAVSPERHVTINSPNSGHFAKAKVSFDLKFAPGSILSPTNSQLILQLRNVSVTKKSEDPGCFFGLKVNQNQARLAMCGHGSGEKSAQVNWIPNIWYTMTLTYEASAANAAATWAIYDGTKTISVSHTPGTTIYKVGGGLVVHIGQSAKGVDSNLEGAQLRNLSVTLTPGAPWCPGFAAN